MTYLQIIQLFENIADANFFIKSFGHGEAWEINETTNFNDYVLWVIPIDATTGQQTKIRTFTLLVFKRVKKDESDETYILSDCERILDDVIKIFRNQDSSYEVLGDPVLFPFKEEFGDWVAGWRADLQVQTDFDSNYCDVPSSTFVNPESLSASKVIIKDQDGNTIAILNPGSTYTVTIVSAIDGGNATTIFTNTVIGN